MTEHAATPANIPTVRFQSDAIQQVLVMMITVTNVTAQNAPAVVGRDIPKTAVASVFRVAAIPSVGVWTVASMKTVALFKPTLRARLQPIMPERVVVAMLDIAIQGVVAVKPVTVTVIRAIV